MTVGCWNIEGANEKINSVKISKLEQPFFEETLKHFDIFCVQETHLHPDENIPQVTGYVATPHSRKVSGNNRYFGGMIVYIKASIKNGTQIGHNFDVDTLEVKLLKNFFGLKSDVNILFTYASPITSCYTKSRDENILEKIECKYIGFDNLIIIGDLNGKTKEGEDFVVDENDRHSPINVPFYTTRDRFIGRENMDDHPIDEQGKIILDPCKSTGLRILNGRIQGDKQGLFTRYSTRNVNEKPSVIDYAVCSKAWLPEVLSFSVLPYTGHSDHCCVSLKIKTNTVIKIVPPPVKPKCKNFEKTIFTYDKRKREVYEHAIRNDTNFEILKNLLDKKELTNLELNDCVKLVNLILLNAAKKVKFSKKTKRRWWPK